MKKLSIFLFVLMTLPIFAQRGDDLLAVISEEEQTAVEALVMYPLSTRSQILEIAQYPELLARAESVQKSTRKAFEALLQPYPRDVQSLLWDITRFPGLVEGLVELKNGTSNQVEFFLESYPPEISQQALEAWAAWQPVLYSVQQLNFRTQEAFEGLIAPYSSDTKDAFRGLLEFPEVLDILVNNLKLTVILGDLYRKNPQSLQMQLDELSLEVARQNAKDLEDWKASLESNPEVKEEFLEVSKEYAEEYDYDDAFYTYEDPEVEVVRHQVYYHYPYWYGYPSWYLYPRWRPYPYWYDWGFYWLPNRTIVIIDLPSFYFTHWYFHNHHHHHHYAFFSSHMVNFYYGHRQSRSSITAGVRNWKQSNAGVVTDSWLEGARKNPTQFKEFAEFESSREKYNTKNREKPLSQEAFLDKNTRKYPILEREVAKKSNQPVEKQRVEEPAPAPSRVPPRTEPQKSKIPPGKEPLPSDKKRVEPSKKPNEPETRNQVPKVEKARDYHQNKWEKPKVEPQKTRAPSKSRKINPSKANRAKTSKKEGG